MKIIISILILFSSCTSLKNVRKETEKVSISEKETVEKHDSIVNIKQNRAINDKFVLKVPKSSSSDIDARLDEILHKLNFQKTSGTNSYQISYNPKKREIEGSVEVGATEDKSQSSNTSSLQTTTDSNFLSNVSKKTGIPTIWIIAIIVFLLRSQIFWLLKKLFPILQTLKIVKYFK